MITEANRFYLLSLGLTVGGLLLTLMLGLLPALLGGLLVYLLVTFGARLLVRFGIGPVTAKTLLLLFVATIVVSAIAICVDVFASRLTDGPESLVQLLQRMADVVDRGRNYLPLWAQGFLPANIEEWQIKASEWLRGNARHLSEIGRDVGVFLFHLLAGMIIGGLVAFKPGAAATHQGPLARALCERVDFISQAFRRIVFSQVRISALNTLLTGIFLVVVLPLLGSPLPLTKTMIAVTFIAGLLPIVGNLVSNTVITLIGLSVSPVAAVGSLLFLIGLHKLEYFVNARIIGSQIRAKAWEILLAMLVMEAAFGLAGLVAAPIYYAYLKDELSAKKLI